MVMLFKLFSYIFLKCKTNYQDKEEEKFTDFFDVFQDLNIVLSVFPIFLKFVVLIGFE